MFVGKTWFYFSLFNVRWHNRSNYVCWNCSTQIYCPLYMFIENIARRKNLRIWFGLYQANIALSENSSCSKKCRLIITFVTCFLHFCSKWTWDKHYALIIFNIRSWAIKTDRMHKNPDYHSYQLSFTM